MVTRRQVLKWLAAFGGAAGAAGAYGFTIEPLLRPRITRYELVLEHWPQGLEVTVAALADFHACNPWMSARRIASIVEQTNGLGADLIVLLGDYVAGHHFVTDPMPSSEWAQALSGLKAPLGVHAILGNHDWWSDKAVQRVRQGTPFARGVLEDVGIPVYDNEVVRLTKTGRAFWLAGLGDQLAFWTSRHSHIKRRIGVDDLSGTLAKVTDDAPIVLLAHEPDIAPMVPERVSLMLSGHTHGGQVRLLGWSPIVPSRYGNRFAYGHLREQCDIIVSGGLGCSIVPVRFGVPPEIVLVTLRARDRGQNAPAAPGVS
jgi:predicted MPP superfamily phosphohydrolase